jgi:hypothetical protein
LAGGVGEGLVEILASAFGATGFDFCGRGFVALVLFGAATFETAFGFDDRLGVDDLGFAVASERGLAVLDSAFARAAGFVFVLAREAFAFAATAFGVTAALAAFRCAAVALDAAFREGAGLAAAVPRLVVFAMVLASIPPAGTACGHRLCAKRGF